MPGMARPQLDWLRGLQPRDERKDEWKAVLDLLRDLHLHGYFQQRLFGQLQELEVERLQYLAD